MNLGQIKINAIVAGDPEKIQFDGNHYKGDVIPLHEFLSANNVSFLEGNAIKYVYRHGRKNKERDIAKAIHCLQLILRDTYNKYLVGAELYTKEQYDELISQAKKEAESKGTETTVIYTDKEVDIKSESKNDSKENVYVRKLHEVKAVYVEYRGGFKSKVRDVGLSFGGYRPNKEGVWFEDIRGNEIKVPYGYYVVLDEDGKYNILAKDYFEMVYEHKF